MPVVRYDRPVACGEAVEVCWMQPFRYRRRVGFGECDPARILFAPRAIDWAVEAAEAYCEGELGLSWARLAREGREVGVLAADCAYEGSVTAGDEIEIAVAQAQDGGDRLVLDARAERAKGEVSFRARLELAVVERGWEPPAPGEVSRPGPAFTVRRRVSSGDCGPSADVQVPRLADWAVEAAGEWYEATLGISWVEQCRRGRGTPFLRIRVDRLGRLEPGALAALDVSVPRLGKASIDYAVVGRDARGAPCFTADMSACYITEEAGPPRAMPFPDALRARILAFQAGAGPGGS